MLQRIPLGKSEHGEDARAFLQSRVALFWKVFFVINLLSVAIGAVGLIADPGVDFLLNIATTIQCGVFWWFSARGKRSFGFCRFLEAGGLLINVTMGVFLGRYFSAEFAAERSIATVEGALMADAFISMMMLGGITMVMGIRSALIPSSPTRTVWVTAMIGVPGILVTALLEPASGGHIQWRSLDSGLLPWLPIAQTVMWCFGILTSAVISRVVYGLRDEVRQARQLGQYTLEGQIGEGGMGQVYRAHHGMMRRPSAVKLLHAEKSGELDLRRFEREVQLTARLTHPNTITLYDYGRTADDVFYYAMELLTGATLQQVVAVDGAQPVARVLRILSMVCGALSEAHALGLIHRDLKPANIMLCTQGGELDVVKVLDFGLVKELKMDNSGNKTDDVQMSYRGTITGTPQYMAPESIRDPESVDARTDIYALGAVAYYLLAGSDVFDGTSVVEICSQHLFESPQSLLEKRRDIPTELNRLVLACLEKDPSDRPQSASALQAQLRRLPQDQWESSDAQLWWQKNGTKLIHSTGVLDEVGRTVAVNTIAR